MVLMSQGDVQEEPEPDFALSGKLAADSNKVNRLAAGPLNPKP